MGVRGKRGRGEGRGGEGGGREGGRRERGGGKEYKRRNQNVVRNGAIRFKWGALRRQETKCKLPNRPAKLLADGAPGERERAVITAP